MTNPPRQLYLHREYLDPSLAPFGERHLEYLRYLYKTGVRQFNKTVVTNRYTALLRINNEHLHVLMLPGGEVYFEFMTSGKPLKFWTFTAGSVTGQAYYTGVVGVTTKQGALTAVLRTGERVQQTALGASKVLRGNQVQLVDEPVHYYTQPGQAPRQLYDAWAPLHPHTGLHFHTYNCFLYLSSLDNVVRPAQIAISTHLGSFSAHYVRDKGYDQVWGDNKGTQPIREAAITSAVSDWPRQAGLQVVKHATYGSREFAIYVDAFDQVSVFPTDQIVLPLGSAAGVPLQNVDPAYVKTVRVTLPSWVYAKTQRYKDWYAANSGQPDDVLSGLYEFPEYDWKIHPDGTKMCAVVYERIAAQFDAAYYAPYATEAADHSTGPGTYYPDAASFAAMNAATMGVLSDQGILLAPGSPYYQCAPGLLEVAIQIELTSPAAEDFTVTLATDTLRRPTSTIFCTFFAGYVWHDVKAKDWTKENKKFDAKRGDLCVLDIECYGNLTTNKAADLYSLKNLTDSAKEINVFGCSSGFSSGAIFTGMPGVLAVDMRTLSFVFKYRNIVGSLAAAYYELPFGVSVYVMNKHQQTFLPNTMPQVQKDAILNKVNIDQRAAMNGELPGLTLMPLNDLRDWTDPDLASLREHYVRVLSKGAAQTFGAYAGNPRPYANPVIDQAGYKYWKTGSYATPAPSTAAMNWYNYIVRHGQLPPYALFDLVTPRPGWWQHAGQIVQRVEINPHTTFFTHPNGSWAFFNQDMIYNGNGIPLVFDGLGTAGWDAAKMEHCIFDQVSLVDSKGTTLVSSFLKLYNQAVKDGTDQGKITDDSVQLAVSDLKATFTAGTVVDPYNPALTYAQMRIDWPVGFSAYYRDMAYFTGSKGSVTSDGLPMGGSLDLSLSVLWKVGAATGSGFIAPNLSSNMPYTFSTCLLITIK